MKFPYGISDFYKLITEEYLYSTETFMASSLYYLGVLTLGGINQDGKLILQIPNLVIQGFYAERLAELM